MKLQTQITINPERNQINYDSKVLLLGSCFVEHIGEKLGYYKFKNLQNPFGIVFHPLAIERLVTRAINETKFTEADIFFLEGQWHCFEVHSMLSDSNKEVVLKNLNDLLEKLQDYIVTASHIIFTYGTSWVYRFIEADSVVANCHKVPQKKFLKELLSVEEVTASIDNTIALIKSVNPKSNFILTVSPVRHLKDGFIENTRSKAHLIAGLHQLIEPSNLICYFPSYEILMDELRDYRFYKEDLLHPNKTAVSIIWEKFREVWIASETNVLQKEIGLIQAGLQHRPFNSEGEAHQRFLDDLQTKIEMLQQKISHLKF